MIIKINEIDNRELTFNTVSEAATYLASFTHLWTFTHLGGYELMRDGTQTSEFSSHSDAIDFLYDLEIFEEYTNEELHSLLFKDFQSDADVYEFIDDWYSARYNDGGGWGDAECSDITNLLEDTREYCLPNAQKDY